MLENGLRKLFRINKIKILMSVTGLHNKATCRKIFQKKGKQFGLLFS
jgi:hypothetical protein